MYQLTKVFFLALIMCGDLLSLNIWRSLEARMNAPRHGTKPGSFHRKARKLGSRPSSARDVDRKIYGKASDSYGSRLTNQEPSSSLDNDTAKPTADLTEDYEKDVVSRNVNITSDFHNSTCSSLGTSSSAYNGLQLNDSNSYLAHNGSNYSLSCNQSQLNDSTSSSTYYNSQSNESNFSSTFNASQFNDSTADLTNSSSSSNQIKNSSSEATPSGSLISELPQDALQKSNLFLGFLPDDGSSGGTRQTIAQLNTQIGQKSAVYGWYAQAHSGTPFDGSQILAIIDDVKACNCVFQPAIMPIGGWQGFTSTDNSQAVAIAQVLKTFTDQGIPVWLRFAHEANYYQTDGTYQGSAADFKAGWAAVSAAIKEIAPSVKMWWTPNVSTAEDYEAYEPDDMSTVDLVGIDYYPKQLNGNDFLDTMKEFHDKYAVDGRKFAIGETGLGWSGNTNDKTQWFNQICDAKSSLPEFISMAWFNFDKEYDYKIAGEAALNQEFIALVN